jgi:hypothetical protein
MIDDLRFEREAAVNEIVERAGQPDLGDIHQEIDVLGESGAAANRNRQTADQRISD